MNGILIINKNIGYTSRDIVNAVSKAFDTKKVGHTGTLDPMASGVLVLCVGKALKMCELLINHDKEYIAGITLGIETDTLDMDGKILNEKNVKIDKGKIISVVNSFKGKYMQEVPIFSAVKVNGKKLYEYARNNIPVDLPSREVYISNIEILDDITYIDGKINFNIKCTVSKGTYIRSLVRDIGKRLGTIAVMSSLVRTRVGNFTIQDSYSLDDIQNKNFKLINIIDSFPTVQKINVNDDIAYKIRNGVVFDKFFEDEMAFILDNDNKLIALYRNIGNKSRAYKMFM